MNIDNQNKLERAKKRVDAIKGFYIHLAVYILINSFILVNIYIRTMAEGESFWKFSTFFTIIFWGIGLFFHWAHVFNFNPLFGKKWEERQIQKYIEKDKREADKFK
ncbi:MAG: 2TM domain-containing protein [Eudoraea sp.]|nr:2TM domain-containing protein [Eudoraea sp.]NNL01880.1 2TM domain-containing protein [Eudoraea sp.]